MAGLTRYKRTKNLPVNTSQHSSPHADLFHEGPMTYERHHGCARSPYERLSYRYSPDAKPTLSSRFPC